MNFDFVSLIVPHDAPASPEIEAGQQAIERDLRGSGLQVSVIKDSAILDHLAKLAPGGEEPAAVLIGPGVAHPLPLARRIRKHWPVGQILFVPGPAAFDKLRQDLRYAPMIGPNWSLLELESPSFARNVTQALASARQRLRLRTTLDKANMRLAAPKPVDSLEYRRTVISEHYLANLLQQSSDAIVTLDMRDTLLYWSPSAERMFGAPSFAAHGKAVSDMPFWSPQLEACLGEIHGGRRHAVAEIRRGEPASERTFEIACARVLDANNAFIGTSLTIRDTSERSKLLDRERAARREAERMSRMKDEFLAILSHELRTPLSAVIGRAQLLMMQHRDNPALASALAVIERNAELQAKLIDDLLDVSSVITGKLQLDMQPVSVGAWIDSAIESVRSLAEDKKIQLHTPVQDEAGCVEGDAHRLQQILYNLLSNAIKFTPEGGQVHVLVHEDESSVHITVRDTGIGISPDFLPLVFDRFGQEDASITRRHGGLGLGLSITKQLVERMGGTIRAASRGRDQGTSFIVSFPLLARPQAGKPSSSSAKPADADEPLRDLRILVVEDIKDSRELIVDVLQTYGAEVAAVDSAEAALQALQGSVPDVVVSDIAMPHMDGYELIKRIRAAGLTSDRLPAIALTAFAGSADRARALVSGFQSHVAKPLIASDLVSAISGLIRSARP